jgi:hypothetical protein
MTQGSDKLPLAQRRRAREKTTAVIGQQGSPDAVVEDQRQGQITTGVVDDISPDGVARVVLSGEERPREASSLVRFPSGSAASEALLGRTVVVVLNQDAAPVILGVVEARVWDTRDPDGSVQVDAKLPPGQRVAVQADKRQLEFEASDEIRLTCGKSSLVMRRDGTVVIRGVTIISRASQSNKIRGGTVSIN